MARKKSREQLIEDAADAHTTLVIFAMVVRLLEGSDVDMSASSTRDKIIGMCEREESRQLKRYDKFRNEAAESTPR